MQSKISFEKGGFGKLCGLSWMHSMTQKTPGLCKQMGAAWSNTGMGGGSEEISGGLTLDEVLQGIRVEAAKNAASQVPSASLSRLQSA